MELGKVLRVIFNSTAFVILLAIGLGLFDENPALALLVVASSLDQFEDVYYLTTGQRLIPKWFAPVDVLFEGIATGIGLGLLLFGIMYYSYFASYFFVAMIFVGIMVMLSSLEDIGYYFGGSEVMHAVEVREKEKRFVKRK
ncbi:MAG: hypothetical protein ACP5M7_09160 [Thermoproteota archaeon]